MAAETGRNPTVNPVPNPTSYRMSYNPEPCDFLSSCHKAVVEQREWEHFELAPGLGDQGLREEALN